jgi:disulfide bond formation protein DsbB
MSSLSSAPAGPGTLDPYAPFAPLAIVVASVLTLGAALISQYGFGLEPCELCLLQRWPYVATIVIGLLAAAVVRRGKGQAGLVLLAGLVFLIGAGIAFFHVGVEQHLWAGTAECTGPAGGDSIEALRKQLVGRPIVRCDQVAFRFLGVSMAGWNMLVSLVYAIASFAAGRALWRRAA